jgi:hypothetical protein
MLRSSLPIIVALACVSASHAATICDRRGGEVIISPMTYNGNFPMHPFGRDLRGDVLERQR